MKVGGGTAPPRATRRSWLSAPLLALLASAAACGGADSPAGPTATDYSGTWQGLTSDLGAIRITVAGPAVTIVSVALRVTYLVRGTSGGVQVVNCQQTFTSSGPAPIRGDRTFEARVAFPGGATSVRGTFSSQGFAARGSVDAFTLTEGRCDSRPVVGLERQESITWIATPE